MDAKKFLEEHKTLAEQEYTLQDLVGIIAELVLEFTTGENYKTMNPYTRPVVKKAMKILASETGKKDYMDVKQGDLERLAGR